ncbi:MAG: phospholipase D-like domain-containing protein [Synechococcus sp.]|nr:phospholipase D-like domain-containing protein [Synechococcus sp.]
MTRHQGTLSTVVLAVMALLCCSCSQAGQLLGQASPEPSLPSGVAVDFNHRDGARYRNPIDGQWRNGDNLEARLIAAIDAAQQECLVAVQELSLPAVAQALVRAQHRGVQVKVVLENSYRTPWSSQHPAGLAKHQRRRLERLQRLADQNGDGLLTPKERTEGDAIALLEQGGVPLIDDTEDGSQGSGLMHHKFMVIDQRLVVTGSANFTSSGIHGDGGATRTRGNVNHLLQMESRDLAQMFANEFARMWGDGPRGLQNSQFGRGKGEPAVQQVQIGAATVTVLFAPHAKSNPSNGLDLIASELGRARRSIDMALFVFSSQQLADTLETKSKQGVEIRLLADPGFASRSFSEVLDLLGVSLPDHNCQIEPNNRPYTHPLEGVGTPRLARGDKLHHKFAVIDNKTVITGSFNWSPSAAHTNDETLLIIESPDLAAHFTREMNRMWRGADLGITERMRRKLERQRELCGSGSQRG